MLCTVGDAQASVQISRSHQSLVIMTGEHHYVQLTLENIVLPRHTLVDTPSMKDGLDPDVEMDLRIYGCELIQLAGVRHVEHETNCSLSFN